MYYIKAEHYDMDKCFAGPSQVPFQWPYVGSGSDPPVSVGCFLHSTVLQGPAQTVSLRGLLESRWVSNYEFWLDVCIVWSIEWQIWVIWNTWMRSSTRAYSGWRTTISRISWIWRLQSTRRSLDRCWIIHSVFEAPSRRFSCVLWGCNKWLFW